MDIVWRRWPVGSIQSMNGIEFNRSLQAASVFQGRDTAGALGMLSDWVRTVVSDFVPGIPEGVSRSRGMSGRLFTSFSSWVLSFFPLYWDSIGTILLPERNRYVKLLAFQGGMWMAVECGNVSEWAICSSVIGSRKAPRPRSGGVTDAECHWGKMTLWSKNSVPLVCCSVACCPNSSIQLTVTEYLPSPSQAMLSVFMKTCTAGQIQGENRF